MLDVWNRPLENPIALGYYTVVKVDGATPKKSGLVRGHDSSAFVGIPPQKKKKTTFQTVLPENKPPATGKELHVEPGGVVVWLQQGPMAGKFVTAGGCMPIGAT